MLMVGFGVIMIVGILAGARLSWIPRESRFRKNVQYALLFTLLFVLGHQLGSDDAVAASISQMGFIGIFIAAAGMSGSFLMVLLLRTRFEKERKGPADD
ncbi:MAG: LysO family transporter [Eubacteriales bacterium]|nr:LysO family transporter [Eubacteriales bacterium]